MTSSAKRLEVPRIGVYDGGDRAPEDFPFPSCLAAALEAMGQPNVWDVSVESGKTWRNNLTYRSLLAASGMGFALLWSKGEPCPSAADLMQAAGHNETIRRAFAYAGRHYETVEVKAEEESALFARIRSSIDAGAPVIAFGVTGPPEACLITGYDAADHSVIGWAFFPDSADLLEPNGMFRKSAWAKDTWKLIFIGDRIDPTLSDEDVIRNGADLLRRTATEDGGYHIGDAAFAAWRAYVEAPLPKPNDEADCRGRHSLHNIIVGGLAEARAYTGGFLRVFLKFAGEVGG